MKEVNSMHYDSKKVARERAIRDKISLVLIVLIGIGLVIYAIVLQKQVIDADMQEYEQLSQQVQQLSSEVSPEHTVQLLQPEKTNTPVQQATDDAGQPTTEPVTESSPMPAIALPDLPTATVIPTNETTSEAQPAVTPADSNVAPALKPGATEIQPGSTPQPVTGKTGADLVSCKAANDDFIAWLKIPGTKINYPVVLTDKVDYYLTHTFTGKQSKIGTLFSLGRTDYETPGQNIAVYGHHITTGGGNMFQPLLSYKKQSFWEKHQTVYFDTLYDLGEYTVFAVFNMTLGEWDVAAAGFADELAFQAFLTRAQAAFLYDTGITVDTQDHILTLITCDRSYHGKDGRFIPYLQGKRTVNRKGYHHGHPNGKCQIIPYQYRSNNRVCCKLLWI